MALTLLFGLFPGLQIRAILDYLGEV